MLGGYFSHIDPSKISNITKVCVQNVLRVLECKLEDVDAAAWSLPQWTPGGNVSYSAIRRDLILIKLISVCLVLIKFN